MRFEDVLRFSTKHVIDATLTIKESMVTYPDDPKPEFQQVIVPYKKDRSYRITKMMIHSHLGTHVDFPSHVFSDTTTISNEHCLDALMGQAIVLDISKSKDLVTKETLMTFWNNDWTDCILVLKTGCGKQLEEGLLPDDYPVLSKEAASFLISKQIKAIGVDALSIDSMNSDSLVLHETFLQAGVPIIEGLYLERIPEGKYWMWCLPLKLKEPDGAPARVMMIPLPQETDNSRITR